MPPVLGLNRRRLAALLGGGAVLGVAAPAAAGTGLALVERFVAALNAHDVSRLDEVYAATYVNHQTLVGATSGVSSRDATKAYFQQRIMAFPDLSVRADPAFESGDFVGANFIWSGTQQGEYLGIPASGKHATWNSTDLLRVQDGRFSDHWGAVDLLGLMRQLRG
jgi:predicted ester cyclase